MSEHITPGFIVRGIGLVSGRTLYSEPWGDRGETRYAEDARGPRHENLEAAVRAAIAMHADCKKVEIVFVDEGGAEEVYPSYCDALLKLSEVRQAAEFALSKLSGGMQPAKPAVLGTKDERVLRALLRMLGGTA